MYTELHLHDHYSTLDGLNTPREYMVRAKELGMTHLAQTNHGTLGGHREFQQAAKEAGIIPILGVEAYISETDRFDRRQTAKRQDGTSAYNHIILLAQGEGGLKTLNHLNQIAWTEGFYNKPRIDLDALEEHNEGLIVLSGCLNGLLCKAFERGDIEGAERTAQRLKSMLPGRFYIEIQGHNPEKVNHWLLDVADRYNIPAVVTSDCHYARKEDLWIEEAMLILSTNPNRDRSAKLSDAKKLSDLERFNYLYPDRRMTFQEYQIYLRDRESHQELLLKQGIDRNDVYENTNVIARSIGDYPYYQNLDLLPAPKRGNPDEILTKKAFAGLRSRGFADDPEYIKRLEEELDIIKGKNFSSYFLIVSNMVSWAKDQGIMVGPGRGSAAGSLVCYSLGITNVDPIKYGLLFFRFINPDRNDYPDIDTDFQHDGRGKVKDYLKRKFTNVASIATYTYFKDKQVIKDAAKVYGIPIAEAEKATKHIADYDDFLTSPRTKDFRDKYPEVIRLCDALRGRIRSVGMHPAGMVIANAPLAEYMPIETAKDPNDKTGPRIPLIPMDMEQVADIGGIKLDVLGLKDLTMIKDTLTMIERRHGKVIDLNEIDLDDKDVYKMLSDGYTKGVAQANGHTFTKWILDNEVREFNDLVIGTSIARPGPLNTVGVIFNNRRFGREPVKYVHPIMEKHTKETLGCIIYQEQVMLAMTDLAGMTMSEADKVRKIIGKKKDVSEFEEFREKFVEGASRHIDRAEAEHLWHDFEQHAGYSFNKSHAVAYSLITYWTAWLKYHYPTEFVYALLKNEDDKDVRTEYLIEAKRLGIKILLPNVNKSMEDFTIEGDAIRFGLVNIKGIGNVTVKNLIEKRPFNSYEELKEAAGMKGSGISAGILKSLNAVGAATFPDNPKRGDERDNLYEYLGIPAFDRKDIPPKIKAQFRPLEDYAEDEAFIISGMVTKIDTGPTWARVEVVDETGKAGIFTDPGTMIETGQMYVMLVADNRIARYATIQEVADKERTPLVEYLYRSEFKSVPDGQYKVLSFRPRITKAGKKMANVVLTTRDKRLVSVLVFPQMFHKAFGTMKEGSVVAVDLNRLQDGGVCVGNIL